MKIHPRKIIRDSASADVRRAALDAFAAYDLTSEEMTVILIEVARVYAGYAEMDDPDSNRKPKRKVPPRAVDKKS